MADNSGDFLLRNAICNKREYVVNKHLTFSAIILIISLMLTSNGITHETDEEYSAPINEAEQVLDSILAFGMLASREDRFGPFMDFILGYPKRNTDFDHLYEPFFTPELIEAWRKAEREQVARDCDGRYVEGQLCGLGFNPLTCGQDDPPAGYVYSTDVETEQFMLISSVWKGWNDPTAVYRMVQREGQWRLDGVLCADGDRFN